MNAMRTAALMAALIVLFALLGQAFGGDQGMINRLRNCRVTEFWKLLVQCLHRPENVPS